MIVEDGEAIAAMDDEIDLDAGAKRHALENAPAGEHRIGGAAPPAVPFEEGAVTIAGHRNRVAHDAAWDR